MRFISATLAYTRGDLLDSDGGAGGTTAVGMDNLSRSVVETLPEPERERMEAVLDDEELE